ncbi:hypothetical protein Q7P37_002347 [Cladosporium fusiforme]
MPSPSPPPPPPLPPPHVRRLFVLPPKEAESPTELVELPVQQRGYEHQATVPYRSQLADIVTQGTLKNFLRKNARAWTASQKAQGSLLKRPEPEIPDHRLRNPATKPSRHPDSPFFTCVAIAALVLTFWSMHPLRAYLAREQTWFTWSLTREVGGAFVNLSPRQCVFTCVAIASLVLTCWSTLASLCHITVAGGKSWFVECLRNEVANPAATPAVGVAGRSFPGLEVEAVWEVSRAASMHYARPRKLVGGSPPTIHAVYPPTARCLCQSQAEGNADAGHDQRPAAACPPPADVQPQPNADHDQRPAAAHPPRDAYANLKPKAMPIPPMTNVLQLPILQQMYSLKSTLPMTNVRHLPVHPLPDSQPQDNAAGAQLSELPTILQTYNLNSMPPVTNFQQPPAHRQADVHHHPDAADAPRHPPNSR